MNDAEGWYRALGTMRVLAQSEAENAVCDELERRLFPDRCLTDWGRSCNEFGDDSANRPASPWRERPGSRAPRSTCNAICLTSARACDDRTE